MTRLSKKHFFEEINPCGIFCAGNHSFYTVERFGHWYYCRGQDKKAGIHSSEKEWSFFTKDRDFAIKTAKSHIEWAIEKDSLKIQWCFLMSWTSTANLLCCFWSANRERFIKRGLREKYLSDKKRKIWGKNTRSRKSIPWLMQCPLSVKTKPHKVR